MNIYIPLHIINIVNILSHIYSLPLDIYMCLCVCTQFSLLHHLKLGCILQRACLKYKHSFL